MPTQVFDKWMSQCLNNNRTPPLIPHHLNILIMSFKVTSSLREDIIALHIQHTF